MKILVEVFHPNLGSSKVNRCLMNKIKQYSGSQLKVRDEYAHYPDWQIDVAKEQALLEWGERIVLQFPFYWYSCPPLLKKWEDDVLEHGWAYGSSGTKLHGKELLLAISPGAAESKYQLNSDFGMTVMQLLAPFKATSNLIGTKFLPPFITYGASDISKEELTKQAEKYVNYVMQK